MADKGSGLRQNQQQPPREETHEERVARASRWNRYNWMEGAILPTTGSSYQSNNSRDRSGFSDGEISYPRLRNDDNSGYANSRTSPQLISPISVANAAAQALRNRGHPVPGENNTNKQGTAKKTGPANSKSSVPAKKGKRLNSNEKKSKDPHNRRTVLPPLSPAGPIPYSPTRDRKPGPKAAEDIKPILLSDLIKCHHYHPTENGVTIRVETGVMACVEYTGYSELNVYAMHEPPRNLCIDDIIIVISKTRVMLARIPVRLNHHHTSLNCRRLIGALSPWLDYSESVTVIFLCPRAPNGGLYYTTESKAARLNTVYQQMQNFAKPIGSFLYDSYFPSIPGDTSVECSITIGPVVGGDLSPLETVEELPTGNIGYSFGQGSGFVFGQTGGAGYGFGMDFSNMGSTPTSTNSFADGSAWPSPGMTQTFTLGGGNGMNQGYAGINPSALTQYGNMNQYGNQNLNQNVNQNQGSLSGFDQSYAQELGFVDPATIIRPQFYNQGMGQQNRNPYAQNNNNYGYLNMNNPIQNLNQSTAGYPSMNNPNLNLNRQQANRIQAPRNNNTMDWMQDFTIGTGYDRTPHTYKRPRVIVRDRNGERIL
ncbi:uncharacterized protein TRUGW13939_00955 [Talaromyces rugulosus]|uniref:Uncharacterized protein n=1 Tax=Talaromyces rugulosus TaxID=121627 RepID=A0A7H8QK65_TALRU|nr:uncharacterized protein TRUGW13939_00955 [Talaromyces rugulosus]QKX53875.1 hypothetical protein TRUGW13939_00955 [Talaromyces rugulosus]